MLIQHRSPSVNKGSNWGIMGGAVELHNLDEPIKWRKVLHGFQSKPKFLPIDYVEKPKELKKYVEYSAKQELCEEGGYGCVGMNEKVTHLKPYFVFKLKDKETGKIKFQYHNLMGLVDRQFSTPITWESVDSEWVDVEDLLDVANGKKKLNDVIPDNRCTFNMIFETSKETLKHSIKKVVKNECKRKGGCTDKEERRRINELFSKRQKSADGYYIRYDDPECALHPDFLKGLQRNDSQKKLLKMKEYCEKRKS